MSFFKSLCLLVLLSASQQGLAQSFKLGWPGQKVDASATALAPADKPNQGVTSPIHRKYMGKIVFASADAPIALQNENEAGFKTELVLGQPIYWRVYLANSLLNYAQRMSPSTPVSILQTHARYRINFYLNGELAHTAHYAADVFDGEQKEKMTTFKDALFAPGQNFPSQAEFRTLLAKNEQKLGPGMHAIQVDLLPYFDYPTESIGSVVATGRFDLKLGEGSISANDADLCLPKAAMADAKLESAILAAFKVKASQGQWQEQAKLARITSPGWSIVKHKRTGNTLKRSLEAVVASSTPGGQCLYQTFGFSQDAVGASFPGDVYLDGVGSQEVISCKCLK